MGDVIGSGSMVIAKKRTVGSISVIRGDTLSSNKRSKEYVNKNAKMFPKRFSRMPETYKGTKSIRNATEDTPHQLTVSWRSIFPITSPNAAGLKMCRREACIKCLDADASTEMRNMPYHGNCGLIVRPKIRLVTMAEYGTNSVCLRMHVNTRSEPAVKKTERIRTLMTTSNG